MLVGKLVGVFPLAMADGACCRDRALALRQCWRKDRKNAANRMVENVVEVARGKRIGASKRQVRKAQSVIIRPIRLIRVLI